MTFMDILKSFQKKKNPTHDREYLILNLRSQ